MPIRDRQAVRLRIRVPETAPTRCAEQHLWTAMRTLHQFTLEDVVYHATTDEVIIDRAQAARYLCRLRDAGILQRWRDPVAGGETWLLKPAANSGPKPPRIVRVSLVWDDNSRISVGDPQVAEERI